VADSGAVDSGVVDSGVVDSGVADSGTVDSGSVDSGVVDVGDGSVTTCGGLSTGSWTGLINTSTSQIVAGYEFFYTGEDSNNNPVFDIYCIATGALVADDAVFIELGSGIMEFPDHGTSGKKITITCGIVGKNAANVTIVVEDMTSGDGGPADAGMDSEDAGLGDADIGPGDAGFGDSGPADAGMDSEDAGLGDADIGPGDAGFGDADAGPACTVTSPLCSGYDDTWTGIIHQNTPVNVGNYRMVYKGENSSDEPVFDIKCAVSGSTIASGVVFVELGTAYYDVIEDCKTIEVKCGVVGKWAANATFTVKPL
jgi:hypothetical protein